MSVFTLNIHHSGDHGEQVPPFLQIFAFKILSKVLFIELVPYHSINRHVKFMYEVGQIRFSIHKMTKGAVFQEAAHTIAESRAYTVIACALSGENVLYRFVPLPRNDF